MTLANDPPVPGAAPPAPLGELGGYQLLERIGAGALGEVYRARDTVHGRTVAIKRIPAALSADPEWSSALHDAAVSLAAVSHPAVAMLYECAECDGALFVAQEFVPGQTLTQVLAGRPVNALRAVDLSIRIADALAALHAAGQIHGDLRPDNVVVTPKGQVKLLDAGLARFTGGGAVRALARAGTLSSANLAMVRYLSPEEAIGEAGDHRADLFAVGLMLYEMLTGQPAFARPDVDATVMAILRDPAPSPGRIQATLPAELNQIVRRALAKPVDARYQSAGQLADDLRGVKAALDDELDEAEAAEPERRSPAWRWVVGVAALGAALAGWMLMRP